MSKWTDKDTSKATGDSASRVEEAYHDARDHAESSGEVSRGSGPGESHGETETVSLDDLKDLADAVDEGRN